MKHEALLQMVGARVRKQRETRGLTRREFAERSGVSERFLAQLEAGRGNISLSRFADVADALGTTPSALLASEGELSQGRSHIVSLLGVRGAGKSTVGTQLATHYRAAFIEVDEHIERASGLTLSEIFELHGEAYYRRLEREVLRQLLLAPGRAVLATGGSIVSDPDSFALLRQFSCTIWLRARAEDHWQRVIQQGDGRPMARNPHAFAELQALLTARAPLYGKAAHIIDTSAHGVSEVVAQAVAIAAPTLASPS